MPWSRPGLLLDILALVFYLYPMQFSSEDRKRISDYYDEHLAKHGAFSPLALSWTSQEEQLRRFQALFGVGDLKERSILDVGCGLGDFYHFLKLHLDEFEYLGIDIVPSLIEKAREKYPQANFEVADFLEFEGDYFDYVFCSGALSFKVPNHQEKYFAMIKKMYELSREGVAFNMLDRKGHVDDELYSAYSLEEVKEFCQTITPKLKVINDYSPQDFSIFLYH